MLGHGPRCPPVLLKLLLALSRVQALSSAYKPCTNAQASNYDAKRLDMPQALCESFVYLVMGTCGATQGQINTAPIGIGTLRSHWRRAPPFPQSKGQGVMVTTTTRCMDTLTQNTLSIRPPKSYLRHGGYGANRSIGAIGSDWLPGQDSNLQPSG